MEVEDGSTIRWPFEIPPRDVQKAALQAGHLRRGFGYFMRMRMGKTGTVLADYALHLKAGRVSFAIVVVPNSLKRAWIDALGEWSFDVPRCMYEATPAGKLAAQEFFETYMHGVFVINYDSLDFFFDYLVLLGVDLERCMLICDESTSFKDPKTNRAKILLRHKDMFGYTRVLSGKPRANSNIDLWPQLRLIHATSMGWFSFRNTFCIMGGWQGRQAVADNNSGMLAKLISDHGFVAGDEYLKDLPEKIYMPPIEVAMTKEQAKYYKEMEKDFFTTIEEDKCTASIALVKYLRLRQITSGIYGMEGGTAMNLFPWNKNPRVAATLELIEGTPNKALIVANFINSLDNLNEACKANGYNPALIRGGMTADEMAEQKRMFNQDDDCRVMIGQESIMQFGHMLAGPERMPCDTIIFYENDFSLINRAQSEARPEVLGRKMPIAIYDFFSSPMDRHIIASLRNKENGAIALMGYARSQGILPLVSGEAVGEAADTASDNEFLTHCAFNDAIAIAGF